MNQSITKAKLDKLIANHNQNRNLKIVTDAVFVSREHFDEFRNNLPRNSNAIKICFIRHKFPPPDARILPAEPGNDLTQLSLIFVPVRVSNFETWTSTESTDQNDLIPTLCFCEPGKPDDNKTGHCPPASGCPGGI